MAAMPVPMAPAGPPPVPTDLTGVCFRNQWFLNAVGGFLAPGNVFDYFAGSPFYDANCNNEKLRLQGVHPLDSTKLKTMIGWEYWLHEFKEPFLFVLKKQERFGPERTTASAVYYVLDGSVYQAPTVHAIIGSRTTRAIHHLRLAFNGFRDQLHDTKRSAEIKRSRDSDQNEAEDAAKPEDPVRAARMGQVLFSALQRLPPAPKPALPQAGVSPPEQQHQEQRTTAAPGTGAPAPANPPQAGAATAPTPAPTASGPAPKRQKKSD